VRVYRFGHNSMLSTPCDRSPAEFEGLGNLYLAQAEQLKAGSGGGQQRGSSVGEPT